MTKKLRLNPTGWRLYVKPHEGEEGVTIPDELKNLGFEVKQGMDADEVRRNVLSLEMGRVVSVGPLCWMKPEMQGFEPDKTKWIPWAKVGDQVIFAKYAGKLVRDPDSPEYYFLMNDEDIQSVIEEATKE